MTSQIELQDLGLIDLLNERHRAVQDVSQKAWDEKNEIYISDSGWSIMACIYDEPLPVSSVTRQLDISRQAIHKFIKSLSEKGLIDVYNMASNKKEKCIALTAFGKTCYKKKITLKNRIEEEIVEKLGEKQVMLLKDILKSDWGV